MPKKPKYRLQVLITIKEKAKRAAEMALAKAIKKLSQERQKLEKLAQEKVELGKRIAQEYEEMRVKIASGGAKMRDPQVALNFIRKLKEDLEDLERRIEEQKDAIQSAEKYVARSKTNYVLAAQELNVMEQHKELWTKKVNHELSMSENKMLNELGNVIHQMNKMR